MDLPMMSMVDEVALPQIADPTSKMKKKIMYVHCKPKLALLSSFREGMD